MNRFEVIGDHLSLLPNLEDQSRFEKRRKEVFSSINNTSLDIVSNKLKGLVNEFSDNTTDPKSFKEAIYAYFLVNCSYFASIDISREVFEPDYWDFLYFNLVYATTSGGGEITPNKTWVRVVASMQIILTHLFLGWILYALTSRRPEG